MTSIAAALEGRCLFISGATGFLGKVLVEKLLWSVPEVGPLLLLLRAEDRAKATARLHEELIDSPVMARLRARHGADWPAWAASKLEAIPGDLAQDRFGLSPEAYSSLAERVDRVVANGATVTFDERIDRALEINTEGAHRQLRLAQDAGNAPLVLVSTCFVSGQRRGAIEEAVVDRGAVDETTVLPALREICAGLLDRQETDDAAWVQAGASAAKQYGFHDIYTLSKALAERLVDHHRDRVPVAIVRPAIVESAHSQPFAGWIEGIRVSDPMLVAYGRGRAETLPGNGDARLPLVPVDHVVHALIAALAALPETDSEAEPEARSASPIPVYQVSSGRNPITLGELLDHAQHGFARCPLRDGQGNAIAVSPVRFVEAEAYGQDLSRKRAWLRRWARWSPRRGSSAAKQALGSTVRTLDHLLHLLEVYQPYLSHGAHYDDSALRALWESLSAEDRGEWPFDVESVDWPDYVANTHVPGLVRYALRAESGHPVEEVPAVDRAAIQAGAQAQAHAATTLDELFVAIAQAHPEAVAFQVCRQGRWLRYRYNEALVARTNLAHALRERYDIGPGDRVVLWSNGRPEWALTALALWHLGAVIVPIDPQWPAEEMAAGARFVDAKLVCVQPRLMPLLQAEGDNAVDLPCPFAPLDRSLVPAPEIGPINDWVREQLEQSPARGDGAEPALASDDLASIIFTSGTTVAPKAVPLSHANYLSNVRDLVPLMQLCRERLVSVLPIHHVFEQMVGWLVPMTGGATFSYVTEIKPAEISWVINTTKPTVLVAVPRLLQLLYGGIMANVAAGGPALRTLFKVLFALSRRRDGERGHKLFSKVHARFGGALRRIATGGSALDPTLGRQFQLMGFKVAEGYGMTETSPVLTVSPWDGIRFGAVGQPLPGVEVQLRPVADSDNGAGTGLAHGEGEIWVRGANVMQGYLANPSATSAAMADGWLNTGDIGSFDQDGYLRISGRTKDVIVTGAGKNIYPEEVEARYAKLDGVAELVALGLPNEDGAERLVLLVVPGPDGDEAGIRRAVAERSNAVPSYQQPSGVEVWRGELPKTTTMKVKRAVLRDAVIAGERSGSAAPTAVPAAGSVRDGLPAEVVAILARVTQQRVDLVRDEDRLADLGVDSLTRVELVGALEARFGLQVDDATAASLDRVEDLISLADG